MPIHRRRVVALALPALAAPLLAAGCSSPDPVLYTIPVKPGPVLTGFQARAGVNGVHYPPGFLRTPDQVARAGYDGLMRGRRVVVPYSFPRSRM